MTMKSLQALLIGVALLLPALTGAVDALECEGCVDSRDIADRSLSARHLAPDAVVTRKIRDSAVTGEKLADGAVGYAKLDAELKATIRGGEAPPALRLVDARGVLIGPVASFDLADPGENAADSAMIWIDAGGTTALLRFSNGELSGFERDNLRFATGDCTGAPFAPAPGAGQIAELRGYGVTPDGRVWRALPETAAKRFSGSVYQQGRRSCVAAGRLGMTTLTEEIGVLADFEPPYRIVIE
jgi:hypothetical protein